MGFALFLFAIILMMASLLFFPVIKFKKFKLETYWIIILLFACLMIFTSSVDNSLLFKSLIKNGGMNPLKLITLFISTTILSIFLDEVGFFKYLALFLISKVKTSQIKLFFTIYLLVSILTIFTSNDVIILTFTPLIIYFTRSAKINPLPYLFGILTAANTWSIILIIGNPTNIYLALNQDINFLDYLKVMWAPGVVAGLSGLLMVYLIFRKTLKEELTPVSESPLLKNRFQIFLGCGFIIATIILLAISNFIQIQMWLISLFMALLLSIIIIIYNLFYKKSWVPIINTYKKAPWNFIPFILGMFVLVEGIKQGGYIANIVQLVSGKNTIINFGILSFITSNLINNQPMSMLFSIILENIADTNILKATYASIIGSNLGVLLSPVGALAGLMWTRILHTKNINLTFFGYIKEIILVGLVTLSLTLLTLFVVL